MTDEEEDPMVWFQGDWVHRSFRDRKQALARDAIAECRRTLAAGRSAIDVIRDRRSAGEAD